MADQPLIVCPVCETRQPNAWFCAVCGKALHALPRHLPVATPALEELEITGLDSSGTNVAVEVLDGLESTVLAPALRPPGAPDAGPARLEVKRTCPSCRARNQLVGDRCRHCGRFVPAEE